jgi:hypothetical protein
MSFLDISQLISSLVVILSALIAGIWTLYRFRKLREAKKSLSIVITPTVHLDDEVSILEVVINLQNTGTVPILGNRETIPQCILHVKKLPNAKENLRIQWDDEKLESIVEPVRFLSYYQNEIVLEPGVPSEVKGYAVVSTIHQGLLLLHAEFVDTEGIWWTDWRMVSVGQKTTTISTPSTVQKPTKG